jgi:dolichol-phosphate mannosyltransferase
MIPNVSIIVPTYNEALNIPILAWLIHKYLTIKDIAFEIIIVDDGSPDGTGDISRKLACEWPDLCLTVISRPRKMGLGSAYMYGLKEAKGEFIILLDADLSHHPK